MAAAAIEQCDWKTLLTPMEDIDLVAMQGNRFMRVQVKASYLRSSPGRNPFYGFMTRTSTGQVLRPSKIDIVALVALDIRKTAFYLPSQLNKCTRLQPHDYTQIDIERITWDNAVAQILGEAHGVCSRAEVS